VKSRVTWQKCGDRQIAGQQGELAHGPGGERGFQTRFELFDVETALSGGQPQNVHDPVPVRV
jgi:hypothetical protein